MNCEQVGQRLDDYVDGTLERGSADGLERHLTDCAECRVEERRLRGFLEDVARLPQSIEPDRDLWEGIADRLDGRPTRGTADPRSRIGWGRALIAASVALVLIGLGYGLRGLEQSGLVAEEKPDTVAPEILLATSSDGHGEATLEVERAFRQVQQQLRDELEERRPMLSAKTVRVVEKNLEIVERSIREIRTALDDDPGNRELKRLLVAAHNREIDLLRRANRATTRAQGTSHNG